MTILDSIAGCDGGVTVFTTIDNRTMIEESPDRVAAVQPVLQFDQRKILVATMRFYRGDIVCGNAQSNVSLILTDSWEIVNGF